MLRFIKDKSILIGMPTLLTALFLCIPISAFAANLVLTPEESAWLQSRNNTIIVYPEKNYPPFSYISETGVPTGLSIDYIKLIAEKIGARIEYLPARPLSEILKDVTLGKGDVVTSLAPTKEREEFLTFTDIYASASAVVIVRNDYKDREAKSFSDFSGKRVAVGNGYAVTKYIQEEYPQVLIVPVIDDEIGLQKVVLGEVDAAVIDIASLSYFMSQQVLSSMKIIANVGFEYNVAFAVPKNKKILRSILNKGITEITPGERSELNKKWMMQSNKNVAPKESSSFENIFGSSTVIFAPIIVALLGCIIYLVRRPKYFLFSKKKSEINELKANLHELDEASHRIEEELSIVKAEKEEIEEKLEKSHFS